MAESALLLMDEVLPRKPMRQWVLSVPFPLRFLFASQPKIMGNALSIVYRTIATQVAIRPRDRLVDVGASSKNWAVYRECTEKPKAS